jgi:hypothetical protein
MQRKRLPTPLVSGECRRWIIDIVVRHPAGDERVLAAASGLCDIAVTSRLPPVPNWPASRAKSTEVQELSWQ